MGMIPLVVFSVEKQPFALRVEAVERIVRSAELTPLPKAPSIVLGVLDFLGQVVPVISLRRRLGFADRRVKLGDYFLVARSERRLVALVVDKVLGVAHCDDFSFSSAEKVCPGTEYVEGVVRHDSGLVLVQDVDRFLSLDEERQLTEALKEGTRDAPAN